jgi:hypothetical protein
VEALFKHYARLCKQHGGSVVGVAMADFLGNVERLRGDGVVAVGPHREPTRAVVTMSVDRSDVDQVMSGKPFWKGL